MNSQILCTIVEIDSPTKRTQAKRQLVLGLEEDWSDGGRTSNTSNVFMDTNKWSLFEKYILEVHCKNIVWIHPWFLEVVVF